MKRRIKIIFLLLLILIPFIKVDALTGEDFFSTTPKSGYRCYLVCKTPTCTRKMVLYTNRDMTTPYDVTDLDSFQKLINNGINLFAPLDYWEASNYTIATYFKDAQTGKFGDTAQTITEKMIEEIKANYEEHGAYGSEKYSSADDYANKVIEQFTGLSKDSDVSPYACVVAAQTFDSMNSNVWGGVQGYHLDLTDNFQIIYENDYNSGEHKLYDLSHEERANIEHKFYLEGTGYIKLISTPEKDYGLDWVNINRDGDWYLEPNDIGYLYDKYYDDYTYEFDSKDKEKLKNIYNCASDIDLTHQKTYDCLECDYTISASVREPNYEHMCKRGFTFGAVARVNQAIKEPASLKVLESGRTTSCYEMRFITYVWLAFCIIAPFLIIIFGSLDFIKAVMAGDEKAQKESKGKFFKRLIAFILFIILPIIIRIIFRVNKYNSGNLGLLNCVVTYDTTSTDPIVIEKSSPDDTETTDKCETYINQYFLTCGNITDLSCCKSGTKDFFDKECTLKTIPGGSKNYCDYKNASDAEGATARANCAKKIEGKTCADLSDDLDCCIKDGEGNTCEVYSPTEGVSGVTSIKACRKKKEEITIKPSEEMATTTCDKIPISQCGTIRDKNGDKCELKTEGSSTTCVRSTMSCNDKMIEFCVRTTDDYGNACKYSTLQGVACEKNESPKSCSSFGSSSDCKMDDWGKECEWTYTNGFGECVRK